MCTGECSFCRQDFPDFRCSCDRNSRAGGSGSRRSGRHGPHGRLLISEIVFMNEPARSCLQYVKRGLLVPQYVVNTHLSLLVCLFTRSVLKSACSVFLLWAGTHVDLF